jgi:hypothetical protein
MVSNNMPTENPEQGEQEIKPKKNKVGRPFKSCNRIDEDKELTKQILEKKRELKNIKQKIILLRYKQSLLEEDYKELIKKLEDKEEEDI